MTDKTLKEQNTEALAWALRAHEDLAKMLADGGGNMLHVRANRALGILFAEVERLEKILYPIGATAEPPAALPREPRCVQGEWIYNTHSYGYNEDGAVKCWSAYTADLRKFVTAQPPSSNELAAALWAEIEECMSNADWNEQSRENLRRLVRTALPPSPEWQPIETAPPGGKWVLLWWPSVTDAPFVGYQVYDKWHAATNGDTWVGPGPTHWQPLPSPPTKEVACEWKAGCDGKHNCARAGTCLGTRSDRGNPDASSQGERDE